MHFPRYLALKRWAMISRPSGADSWVNIAVFSHRNFENRVLTHTDAVPFQAESMSVVPE